MLTFQNVYRQFTDYFKTPDSTASAAVPKTIDSEYIENLIRKIPGVQEPVTAQPLQGGTDPEAQLFLAVSLNKKFVIRFMKCHPLRIDCQIDCQRIASDAGYGPHVYFADPKLGLIVMAYVEQAQIEKSQFLSLSWHRALGEALSKMHNGPSFDKAYSICSAHGRANSFFNLMRDDIERLKKVAHFESLALRMEKWICPIEQAVSPAMTLVPSHNDLNPSNALYSGSSFTFIDYANSTHDDPFFDLATAIIFNCFDSIQEKALLDAYLKRPLSKKEKAKLFVMKQAVLLCYAARFIKNRPALKGGGLEPMTETLEEIVKKRWLGNDLEKQEWKSKRAHVFLQTAIASLESKEFQEAVASLSQALHTAPAQKE
jgi:thiamine kinase-like enzyme